MMLLLNFIFLNTSKKDDCFLQYWKAKVTSHVCEAMSQVLPLFWNYEILRIFEYVLEYFEKYLWFSRSLPDISPFSSHRRSYDPLLSNKQPLSH